MPEIREIWAVEEETVRVRFDSPIVGLKGYLNPDNYIFTENLEALGVVVVRPDVIEIITTPQKRDQFYTLEIRSDA